MDFRDRISHLTAIGPNRSIGGNGKGQSAGKTAEDFESFLICTILKEYGKATSLVKKSYAEETQMSLFYEKVGECLARKGIGIKDMLNKYAERGTKVPGKNGENR